MQTLVTASIASVIPKNAPGEIVYIPVGANKISATVNGKPGEITVNVPVEKGAAIAASLQKSLEARLAGPVRPRLAFDHSRTGPASGHPSAFSFDPARGIILSAGWSKSGREAIEGGDYGYFSPTFFVDDNGVPAGLPEKGEIGSLVDEPAFRTIGLVAAADTDLPAESKQPSYHMKLVLAHLGIDPAHESAESSAVAKIKATEGELSTVKASLATAESERDSWKTKCETAEKARLDAKVEAAVTAGKIAPKDDETKKEVRDLLQASEALGDKLIASMPVKFESLDKPLVTAGDTKVPNASQRVEAAQSKARTELGANASFSEVWARAAEIDPPAFES